MADRLRRLYWDSSVFLAYLNDETERVDVIEELFSRAQEGSVEIVTSVSSITEVAFVATEQAGGVLSEEAAQQIDKLWSDRSAVRLYEFHELVAREARELIRQALANKWSLKPFDAIHLATASRAGVEECHTYDPKWAKFQPLTKIARICEPYVPGGIQPKLGL